MSKALRTSGIPKKLQDPNSKWPPLPGPLLVEEREKTTFSPCGIGEETNCKAIALTM
jgi:hypothetical protein